MTMMIIILMIMLTATMLCMVWQAGVTEVWSLVWWSVCCPSQLWDPQPYFGPRCGTCQFWQHCRICLVLVELNQKLFQITSWLGPPIWEVTRCLLGMVESYGRVEDTTIQTFSVFYDGRTSFLIFLNLHSAHATMSQQSPNFSISATESNSISTILNTPRYNHEKGVSEQGWWWKPFAWLYGRQHAKFLRATIFCFNLFADDFSQTALRSLCLEIWLV